MGRENMSQGSRISGVGSYGYASVPYNNPDDVPQLSAEQVKAAYNEALREDQATKDRLETQRNGDAFIAGHPEFIDNVANAKLLVHEMDVLFGEGLHPLSHFEAGYESLRSRTNFLALDKTVIAAQQKASAKQRFEAEKAHSAARTFNPNENYDSLSLEEIKERAIEEQRQQMQRRGEEGGW